VRTSTIVMIAFAVMFGLLAVFLAQSWLNSQNEAHMRSLEANKKPLNTRTIVVAAKPLRYGNELTAPALREIVWPQEALPAGAFTTIADVLKDGKRVVLSAIEPNEPLLSVKITGSGQRATLSALVRDGMKAVTIRVNDVEGVGGFVLPGDRVDVVLTRQVDKGSASNDLVLQNARVLAVDQVADERADKPTVAKAVTLEVDMIGAQKLSLASSVGSLSLMLRKAGEAAAGKPRRITLEDLNNTDAPQVEESAMRTIVVRRNGVKQEISVPIDSGPQVAVVNETEPKAEGQLSLVKPRKKSARH
jgi:pilus assembly protein CpaB